jgi:hypothetical protein
MLLRTLALLTFTCPVAAQTLVYSNGPFQSHPNGGPNNAPISVVQNITGPKLNLVSWGISGSGWILADNFSLKAVMLIDEIEFYAYDFGVRTPTQPSAVAEVEVSIWNGDPSKGNPTQLIPGAGPNVNLAQSAGFVVSSRLTGVHRVVESNKTSSSGHIQGIRVKLPKRLTLGAGDYWFGFRARPVSTTTGNFAAIPLTTNNVGTTGNAMRTLGSAWSVLTSSSQPQGLPFAFYGVPTAPAGGITKLGGGCATATLTVEGAPASGGYFHAEFAGLSGTPAIAIGATDPNTPLGCSCFLRSSADVILFAQQLTVSIPSVQALVGTTVFVQGADIQTSGSCPLQLTNGYRFRLW